MMKMVEWHLLSSYRKKMKIIVCNSLKKIYVSISLALISILFFISCNSSIGFGVVVWQDEGDSLEIGQILKVYASSESSKMYIAGIDGENEKFELPMRKLLLANTLRGAEELKEKLEETKTMYAVSLNDGLPIRNEPDNVAKQIYRLKAEQMLKLLWKEIGSPVITGGVALEGEWYKVVTDDGVSGYCFSHNLEIFDSKVGRNEKSMQNTGILSNNVEEENCKDEKLQQTLLKRWYPEYYRKMINNRAIDLEKVSTSYGFFPGNETKTAKVILPSVQRTFQYSTVTKIRDKYRFSGSPLSLYIRGVDVITVEFTDENGRRLYENFVTLNANIEDIIENEKMRRFEEMKKIAGRYKSENYGELEIKADGFFYWTEYTALTPIIIPKNADNGGNAKLKYFLSRSIKKETDYTGVISFQFSTLDDSIDFMYEKSTDGLRMEPILKECIAEGVVTQRTESLILYFERNLGEMESVE